MKSVQECGREKNAILTEFEDHITEIARHRNDIEEDIAQRQELGHPLTGSHEFGRVGQKNRSPLKKLIHKSHFQFLACAPV